MLNVIDVAGQLQLTQGAMEHYAKANPKLVSKITFSQAPAPELPGKLKAQQDAGRVDIDLVLTGTDGLSAGIDQKLWMPLVTDYASALPKLQDIYLPGALEDAGPGAEPGGVRGVLPGRSDHRIHAGRGEAGAEDRAGTAGLDQGASQAVHLRAARPIPGPAAPSCKGLPYILGDKDPMDPNNGWDKTWAYLVELGKNIEYYPTGTGAVMKELGEGSRDMIASHLGWDINPRILGVVPKEAQIGTLEGFHWVTDAQYWAIPKGVSKDKLAVLLDMTNYMLTKPAQAMTYDKGYFYPGPAVKDVPLSMAPQESQDAVTSVTAATSYDKLIAEVPSEVPLPADKLVYAFQRWDQQVGARVGK